MSEFIRGQLVLAFGATVVVEGQLGANHYFVSYGWELKTQEHVLDLTPFSDGPLHNIGLIIERALMSLCDVRVGDVMGRGEFALYHSAGGQWKHEWVDNYLELWSYPQKYITGHVSDYIAEGLRALHAAARPQPAAGDGKIQSWPSVKPPRRETTPTGIARAIMAGSEPEHHERACPCVLCSLPRGRGWAEQELTDRIRWMGSVADGIGRALTDGRTKGDENAEVY